jgi:predicted CopG family antitoxin
LQTSALGLDRIVLTVLQHLLLIPGTVNPEDGFQFLERITRRVTSPTEAAIIIKMSTEEINREVYKLVQLEKMRPPEKSFNQILQDLAGKAKKPVPIPSGIMKRRGAAGQALPGMSGGKEEREELKKKAQGGGGTAPPPPKGANWNTFKPTVDRSRIANTYAKLDDARSNLPGHLQKKPKVVIRCSFC